MDKDIVEVINSAQVIAIIGCSNNPYRTSYHIANYLKEAGFTIIPVHPDYEEVLGEKAYKTVYDIPGEIEIDIVDIFRNSKYTADMIDDIIKRAEMVSHKPVVWTQLGVSSEEAKRKAEEAGFRYVEERCLMVEHRKLTE